jgi:hypothetical protein
MDEHLAKQLLGDGKRRSLVERAWKNVSGLGIGDSGFD